MKSTSFDKLYRLVLRHENLKTIASKVKLPQTQTHQPITGPYYSHSTHSQPITGQYSSRSINTHTHPFNSPLSGTTRVSQYQKGKTNLDFTEARDSELQWYQLGHMQVCISLQTDNHTSTPPLCFYGPDALPATQPTASKYWKHRLIDSNVS